MASKKVSEGISREIKLLRLNKHLEEVELLSIQWASTLTYQSTLPPVPFLEGKPIVNHMLRKHLRRRTLWQNYTEWEQRVRKIRELTQTLFEKAQEEGLSIRDISPVVNAAFKESHFFFTPVFGGEDKQIIEANKGLVRKLASLDEMNELGREWDIIQALGHKMYGLVLKTIKSNDVLYSCRLCKRLWEDD